MTSLHDRNGVTVTPSMLSIRGHNYPIRNISSYRHGVTKLDPPFWKVLALALGVALVGVGLAIVGNGDIGGLVAVAVGAPLVYLSFDVLMSKRKNHHLVLITSAGEVRAYTSEDEQEVRDIAAAVRVALETN